MSEQPKPENIHSTELQIAREVLKIKAEIISLITLNLPDLAVTTLRSLKSQLSAFDYKSMWVVAMDEAKKRWDVHYQVLRASSLLTHEQVQIRGTYTKIQTEMNVEFPNN